MMSLLKLMTDAPRASATSRENQMGTPSPPGVATPGQPRGPSIGSCHQIPCESHGKWLGTLWEREAKGGRPPWVSILG